MFDLIAETRTLKALSIWQPWASLIARGVKRHETRHWSTPYRGPIAIHAAKTLDLAGAPDQLCRSALGLMWAQDAPLGAVIAIAELTAVERAEDIEGKLTRADREAGNYAPGRFAWRLTNVRALVEPIPLSGRQGLYNWTPPEDIGRRLRPALDHQVAGREIGWA